MMRQGVAELISWARDSPWFTWLSYYDAWGSATRKLCRGFVHDPYWSGFVNLLPQTQRLFHVYCRSTEELIPTTAAMSSLES